MEEKLFREDLYYRLNVIPIRIPPLRERKEDIPALATLFLDMHNKKYGTNKSFSIELLDRIIENPWPGNVRELRNFVSRIAIISRGSVLSAELLQEPGQMPAPEVRAPEGEPLQDHSLPLKEAVQEYERNYIRAVLRSCGGNVSMAAKKLGLHRTAIYRKLKEEL